LDAREGEGKEWFFRLKRQCVWHKVVSFAKMLDRQDKPGPRTQKIGGGDNTSSHDSELHKRESAATVKRENSIAEMLFYE